MPCFETMFYQTVFLSFLVLPRELFVYPGAAPRFFLFVADNNIRLTTYLRNCHRSHPDLDPGKLPARPSERVCYRNLNDL